MPHENPVVQPVTAQDHAWVLQLNQHHVLETSHLDAGSLEKLVAAAFQASVIRPGQGFLLAFDQDADYSSENFIWFRERYPHFVYVDRIVVDAACRGQGLAKIFYRTLFDAARRAGHSHICCEVNISPPNIASDRFHAGLGFAEAGTADFPEKGKSVRYLVCTI